MKVCIGTVVYDNAFRFHEDYIDAINCQTNDKYDVLLINDHLNKEQINIYKKKIKNKVFVEEITRNLSIAELRMFLLKKAITYGYDLIILADADDKFSINRVEKITSFYNSKYTFYYNDIYDFSNNLLLKNLPQVTNSIDQILEYNYLGLSNTAINLKNISNNYLEQLLNIQTNIFDWYLFSKMLNDNHMGRYIYTAKTYYRLHENNIAGISQMSMDTLQKEIDVKLDHYLCLKEVNPKFSELYATYLNLKNCKKLIESTYLTPNTNNYWWGFILTK